MKRRPESRPMSVDSQETVDTWFTARKIKIGPGAKTDEERAAVRRLSYIWREVWAQKVSKTLD